MIYSTAGFADPRWESRTGALNSGTETSVGENKVHGAKTAVIVTPISPIADPGKASKIRPKTTAKKIAKKYYAF
jgi:hypothetical protein